MILNEYNKSGILRK